MSRATDTPPSHTTPPPAAEPTGLTAAESDALDRVPRGVADADRPFLAITAVSLALHAAIMLSLMLIGPSAQRPIVAFHESAGVALMSRVGFAPPSAPVQVGPEAPPAVEEPAPTPEPPVKPEPAPPEEPPPPDEAPPEAPTPPDPPPAEEPPAQATPADAAVPDPEPSDPSPSDPSTAPRPSPRPSPEPAVDGSGDGSAAPVDPASLRPAERYPEGTVNPIATDVGMWGPEGAVSVAVIRNDRIRRSEHRAAIETIFGALGDYRDLTRNTQINVIDDVDTMLLASSNPMDASQTFIAAVHGLDPGYLMGQLGRGYPSGVRWEERDGRIHGTPAASALQRRFLIPTDRLFILSQPRFLEDLLRGAPPARGLDGAMDRGQAVVGPPPTLDAVLVELGLPPQPPPFVADPNACDDRRGVGRTRCNEREDERRRDAERARAAWETQRDEISPRAAAEYERRQAEWSRARSNGWRNRPSTAPATATDGWIQGLLDAGALAGAGNDGPAIVWTFRGFSRLELGGLPRTQVPPLALYASLKLGPDPVLRARWQFPTRADAESFVAAWADVCEFYTFPLRAAGLESAFNTATWSVDHDEAVLAITIPRGSMTRIAAAAMMAGLGG